MYSVSDATSGASVVGGDGARTGVANSDRAHPLWRALLTFLLCFFLLQLLWDHARGTPLERWFIERATAGTSAALINLLTPQELAVARGSSIVGRDGAINIRRGCEGIEALFLLIAACMAYPFAAPLRLAGIAAGSVLVFVVNQARLLTLYYSVRRAPALFDSIHGLIAPLVLIVCTVSFFIMMLEWDRRVRSTAPG